MDMTRSLRALAAGAVVALCATGAHLLAGGDVVAWVPLVLVVGAFPVTYAAAGERLGTGQLLGLLVLGQVLVHAIAGHGGSAAVSMLSAHAAATALSLLLVRRGEDAWWRVADALRTVAYRFHVLVVRPTPRTRAMRVSAEPWFPVLQVLVTGVGGRAPPAGL